MTYSRLVQTARINNRFVATPGEPLTSGEIKTGRGGEYTVPDLPVGDYALCANVPLARYVDPCVWRQPVRVTVTAGGISGITIALEMGVLLNVRIDDPLGLLPQANENVWTPRRVLVGVRYGNGAYQALESVGEGGGGRDHRLVVPAGTAFKLVVFSRHLAVADSHGNPVGTAGSQVPFQATAGQDQAFTFRVTGRAATSQ